MDTSLNANAFNDFTCAFRALARTPCRNREDNAWLTKLGEGDWQGRRFGIMGSNKATQPNPGSSRTPSPTARARARQRLRPAASERAYQLAKGKILNGAYPGGELISEGEIAEVLKVSRTPVREAFLKLQSEGLLKLYPKKGAMVVPVSNHEIEMVFETRLVLERFAAEKIIGASFGFRVADTMDEMIARQREALDRDDLEDFVHLDREIHNFILHAAGNSILCDLYASMRDRQIRMGNVLLYLSPSRVQHILIEHDEIADLFRKGELEPLLVATAAHVRGTRDALIG